MSSSLLAACAVDAPQRIAPERAAPGTRSAPLRAIQDPPPAEPSMRTRPEPPAEPPVQPPPGTGDHSYLLPGAEIVAFQVLLNLFDRNVLSDHEYYESDADSIEDNLQSGWVIDDDPFGVNQIGHPYSGSIYHGFARSSGLGFWTSLSYTFVGSALWEVAGEVTKPSLNDQITTGIGGAFLGEGMFRLASWALADPEGSPGFARWLCATALSPSTAFNRAVFGDRFVQPPPATAAPVYGSAGLGVRTHTLLHGEGSQLADERTDALANVMFEFGVPGRGGYRHEQPFDHFHFEAAISSESDNLFDRLVMRGLLVGRDYGDGDLAGVYGLYGSYDYLSPGVFRLASTAVSFGTTAQQRLSESSALQGTALAGIGFGAAGTVADDVEDRDYHYGAIPQGLLDLRWLIGGAAMLRFCGRDHFVFGAGFDDNDGWENVAQLEMALTVNVVGSHALSVGYCQSSRVAHYDEAPDEDQDVGTLFVTWTMLGGLELAPVR